MRSITPTELRSNIYRILDEVLESGVPIEINKGGRRLRIVPVEQNNKLKNLKKRPQIIKGDPAILPEIHWEHLIHLDLP